MRPEKRKSTTVCSWTEKEETRVELERCKKRQGETRTLKVCGKRFGDIDKIDTPGYWIW